MAQGRQPAVHLQVSHHKKQIMKEVAYRHKGGGRGEEGEGGGFGIVQSRTHKDMLRLVC